MQKRRKSNPYINGSEYRYSDLYQRWKSAVKRGDFAAAREAAAEHTAKFLSRA